MKELIERPYFPYLLIGLGLLLGLLVFHLSKLQSFEHPRPPRSESIGILTEARGEVGTLSYGENEPRSLEASDEEMDIYHLDLLVTGPNSSVLVKFPSGYELQVGENSQFLFETWGGDASSPTYIHLISGSYDMRRAGQRGQVLIQHDRKLIYPEGQVSSTPYALIIASTKFELAEGQGTDIEMDPGSPSEEIQPAPVEQENTGELPQTLSNEEIDQVLAGHRLQFERCQTNALRENRSASGKILVGITISNNGKMQEVRAINSELDNPSFQNCILSVFERTSFRAFKGPSITRSYPLIFD